MPVWQLELVGAKILLGLLLHLNKKWGSEERAICQVLAIEISESTITNILWAKFIGGKCKFSGRLTEMEPVGVRIIIRRTGIAPISG